ncbi:hypothetical protein ACUNV4_21040 [Granulosicoccus sp. 3-233]|uniref:hypothetical protein n=1 Tax=Granulosicoccus sp. 3-233 TaxID=3417969 RepID=UPI003D32F744
MYGRGSTPAGLESSLTAPVRRPDVADPRVVDFDLTRDDRPAATALEPRDLSVRVFPVLLNAPGEKSTQCGR